MTVQHKIIVGLEDIQAITFECVHCLSRLTVSPEKRAGAIPAACPHCRKEWELDPGFYQTVKSPFANFTESIERLRHFAATGITPGFRILLEFDSTQFEDSKMTKDNSEKP